MLPVPQNWSIYPSVMIADRAREMIISASERAFIFSDGEEYSVKIISVGADETNYYRPTTHKTIEVSAEGGVLRFTYTFEGEGEHKIELIKDGKKVWETFVFSLYEDLYELTPLRGDFHGHSCRSDGRRDPAALAGHYREQGYDFFSLTDHNRFYPGGEYDEAFEGVNTGIVRVPGEEVHAPGSVIHIVRVFGKKSVAEQYYADREGYERDIIEYKKKVPDGIPEKFKSRYAKAMWATDRIHEAGGIAIFPHPYWTPGASGVYNVCDELAVILLKSGMFDAFELTGAMGQVGINRALALWGELRAEGYNIRVVGSSDVHAIQNSQTFPHCFTVCFARSNSAEDIEEAFRNGRTVAVEAVGTEYERQYRAYGSLRLVTYAQFLLKKYFPIRQRICQGGGVAMRSYLMGEAPAELVSLSAENAEGFALRFFGRVPPILPSAEMINFENRWLAEQKKGPATRGSIVFPDCPLE